MQEVFFNGNWRMDWGLGNPNKTAVLIAMLMVAVWGLSYFRRWGFWVSLTLFVGLGCCLIQTYSRGGIVAAFIGVLPLVIWTRAFWTKPKVIVCTVAAIVLVGFAIHSRAAHRYGQGIVEEDASISNRLAIWKAVPTMMRDAPDGWGFGKAGEAYMQWYQPLDNHEGYRTLVNSHLTWLVEMGWIGRFVYLTGWGTILILCWPLRRSLLFAIPLGVWSAFLVGAFFSSVGESIWLWILPALTGAAVLVTRGITRRWPNGRILAVAPLGALAILLVAWISAQPSPVRKVGSTIQFGGQPNPEVWVRPDPEVFGRYYGRSLREAATKGSELTCGIVASLRDIPKEGAGTIVFGGSIPESSEWVRFENFRRYLLLNPEFSPAELKNVPAETVAALFGEFNAAVPVQEWTKVSEVKMVPGAGKYIPKWAEEIWQKTSGKK